jgi:hypothetical protein
VLRAGNPAASGDSAEVHRVDGAEPRSQHGRTPSPRWTSNVARCQPLRNLAIVPRVDDAADCRWVPLELRRWRRHGVATASGDGATAVGDCPPYRSSIVAASTTRSCPSRPAAFRSIRPSFVCWPFTSRSHLATAASPTRLADLRGWACPRRGRASPLPAPTLAWLQVWPAPQ